MKLLLGTAVTFLLMVGLAAAAQGELCYSGAAPLTQAHPLTNATQFACPSLGVVTIPQIYQRGWRVVHLSHESLDVLEATLEMNDPSSSRAAWMVLIERP